MKKIPDGTVAVIMNTGSVYHPIWQNAGDMKWRGQMHHCANEKLLLAGGVYLIQPPQVERCLTQGEFEIWQLCQRNGLEMPPQKR